MQALAQAQRQYDRQLPADASFGAPDNVMDDLRADLGKQLDAQDISCAFTDRLIESDDDIRLLQAVAAGDDASVLAIVKAALLHVARQRALRG